MSPCMSDISGRRLLLVACRLQLHPRAAPTGGQERLVKHSKQTAVSRCSHYIMTRPGLQVPRLALKTKFRDGTIQDIAKQVPPCCCSSTKTLKIPERNATVWLHSELRVHCIHCHSHKMVRSRACMRGVSPGLTQLGRSRLICFPGCARCWRCRARGCSGAATTRRRSSSPWTTLQPQVSGIQQAPRALRVSSPAAAQVVLVLWVRAAVQEHCKHRQLSFLILLGVLWP